MRTIPYEYGERLASATHSFGRIARGASVDVVNPALRRAGPDAGIVRLASATQPSAFEYDRAARNDRSQRIGDAIVSALRWLNHQFERHAQRRRQRAVVRATYRTLQALDSRVLRDLGIDRGEILSAALDSVRETDSARLRATGAANRLRLF